MLEHGQSAAFVINCGFYWGTCVHSVSLSPQLVSDLNLTLPHADITFRSPKVEFSGAGRFRVSVTQFCVPPGDILQTNFKAEKVSKLSISEQC